MCLFSLLKIMPTAHLNQKLDQKSYFYGTNCLTTCNFHIKSFNKSENFNQLNCLDQYFGWVQVCILLGNVFFSSTRVSTIDDLLKTFSGNLGEKQVGILKCSMQYQKILSAFLGAQLRVCSLLAPHKTIGPTQCLAMAHRQ